MKRWKVKRLSDEKNQCILESSALAFIGCWEVVDTLHNKQTMHFNFVQIRERDKLRNVSKYKALFMYVGTRNPHMMMIVFPQ